MFTDDAIKFRKRQSVKNMLAGLFIFMLFLAGACLFLDEIYQQAASQQASISLLDRG